jgi:hypothetical protein
MQVVLYFYSMYNFFLLKREVCQTPPPPTRSLDSP